MVLQQEIISAQWCGRMSLWNGSFGWVVRETRAQTPCHGHKMLWLLTLSHACQKELPLSTRPYSCKNWCKLRRKRTSDMSQESQSKQPDLMLMTAFILLEYTGLPLLAFQSPQIRGSRHHHNLSCRHAMNCPTFLLGLISWQLLRQPHLQRLSWHHGRAHLKDEAVQSAEQSP